REFAIPMASAAEVSALGSTQRISDAFVYGDMVERSKPHPDVFLKAAEEIGVPIGDCLVLEDSIAGVRAGKAAGGYIIHIPDLIVVPEEVKDGITAQFDSLDEVIGWIESTACSK
ncbi:MAG: HAD family hydrolase, partial [Dorea sp.]|nr:HAD family hydrolase [Dorea sp.]